MVVHASVLAIWLIAQAGGPGGPGWEALLQKGVELRLGGHEEEALGVFRQAMMSGTSPRLLAQAALAEQSLGLWRDAEVHLEQALSSSSDPWIVKQRSALDGARTVIRSHLGSLELRGGEGAEVFVDGRPEGKLPRERPLRVEAGTHHVEVRRDDAYPFVREIAVPADATARETIALLPLRGRAAAAEPAQEVPAIEASPTAKAAPVDAPSHALAPVVGWSLVGVGAAAGGFGVVSLLQSNGHAHDYNDDPACTGRDGAPTTCSASASASREWRTAAVVSLVGAGALVATGVVLLLWKTPGRSPHARISTSLFPPRLDLSGAF